RMTGGRSWAGLDAEFDFTRRAYGVGRGVALLIMAFPWVAMILCGALLVPRSTRALGLALVSEDGPVEWATALPAIAGGLFGLDLVRRMRPPGCRFARGVLALISLALPVAGLVAV